MSENPDAVTATQEDREFAARWIVIAPQNQRTIRDGGWDHHHAVQAAARHRLSAVDPAQKREAEFAAALKAQEDADDARDGCVNCEGEGMWEHCSSCSLTFGRAIDLRRAALNERTSA